MLLTSISIAIILMDGKADNLLKNLWLLVWQVGWTNGGVLESKSEGDQTSWVTHPKINIAPEKLPSQ